MCRNLILTQRYHNGLFFIQFFRCAISLYNEPKKDLIVQLAKKTGSTQSSAKKFLEAFTDLIADNLTVDNKIRIVGFGTFEVRARSERKGINPATKEEIIIPASVTPVFKAGQVLKNIVAENNDKLGK